MRLLAALALAAAPAVAAAADVVSAGPDASALVIYRDSYGTRATEGPGNGIALVIETRTVELPAGEHVIRFRGVSDTLVPQTAIVEGLPGAASERNFDYDLLSPGALAAGAVGERVRLVRTLPGSGRVEETPGIVRSAPEGVLIETAEGVEAYKCSGLPERLVFDRVPAGLSEKPTLSLRTIVPRAGRYTLRLSYITTQFNWSADYVATLKPDGSSLALTGWLTLANQTRTSFPAAPTQVVAGRLQRSDDTQPVQAYALGLSPGCWPTATWAQLMAMQDLMGRGGAAPAPAPPPPPPPPMAMADMQEIVVTGARAKMATQTDLGDYKLYTLPEPTAVAANQVKQVAFLDVGEVAFDRVYRFRGDAFDGESEPADEPAGELVLRMRNASADGLGVALPSGRVTVMQDRAAGGRVFIGERVVEDTSVGLPVELEMGASRDVQVAAEVSRTVAAGRRRYAKTLSFRNVRSTPVEVELRESVEQPEFRLVSEDRPHANRASDLVWTVRLAPGASAQVRYTVETRD